ncbi:MAG: multiheme c-type cytochrome, partial [candidate division KSB1 bacterium]|nr:multiheme c-type cytochrome [candidate division KSB1 bacterium]
IDLTTEPHKGIAEGDATGCMSCHPDKAVEHWAMRGVSQAKILSQRYANLKFTEPTSPKSFYTSDQCLKCHPDRLNVMERAPYLLASEKLAEIGLMLNKRLHYRFEYFRPEDQKLYHELKAKSSLNEDEKEQLALIEKIQLGNCGQCHLREKVDASGKKLVDKTVNFAARNPIACSGCHENVTPLNHPGKPLPMPTEEVCQKCHHGKIHGKFVIFRAECEDLSDQTNCVKCHPYIGNLVVR